MSHANARTNVFARRLIVERVAAGWPAARVAEQLGISRATVYKWLRRYAQGGNPALADRSSRPIRMPNRTSYQVEQKVLAARRRRKRGAVVLAAELGLTPSTVGRILARHQMPHLSAIDPITGAAVRCSRRSPNRYEHPTPGAMVHVDVKKLGRIPPGGGWRLHGRHAAVSVAHRHKKTKIGYDYVHTAIDDYTRLAYSEVLPDEKDPTCAGFLHRALAWFTAHGVRASATDRQRIGLPTRHRLGLGLFGLATQTPIHPTRLSLDQRQSRTFQPHPAQRMGLRPPLDQQHPAQTRP
ncbi:hypothetical protein MSAS_49400 [Mycobacterium saskatchewanense]|nr:hypothetical protein MSAS_49400 [Mycobacterium saskatchewanense]